MEGETSDTLPRAPSQADAIVGRCQATWTQGGREDYREALQNAYARAAPSSEEPSSPNTPLSLLLFAWISQVFTQADLDVSDFGTLLAEVETTTDEHQSPQSDSSKAKRSGTSSVLSDALLDVVWTVDVEIDARKEISLANNVDLFYNSLDEGNAAILDDQVSQVRDRLSLVLQCLVDNNVCSRVALAERLEVTLLHRIGLVQDERDFVKRTIRLNTARLYKQQKFNLLREENEGYSGLFNELISGMGPPIVATYDAAKNPRVVEQEGVQERNARAQRMMNNVSGLIGYFDLDPNRVLDILLDVFSANIVSHWPFFLSLLSISPWGIAPSPPKEQQGQDGATMDVDDSTQRRSPSTFGPIDLDVSNDRGQHTCAQLLGFKFGHYQHPDTKQMGSREELYLLAALLIREGQIRFVDLLPHLTPDEQGMTKLHERYKDQLSDKAMSAKGNALSMAAPLTTDDDENGALSNTKDGVAKSEADAKPHEPPNQVVGLVKALLAIGQFKHALLLLSRYPWMCGAYPEVADLYCRSLNVMIEPAYSLVSLAAQEGMSVSEEEHLQRFKFDAKRQEMLPVPSPRLEITSIAPQPLATSATRFVYFYNLWQENLPKCSANTVLSAFVPLLRILGAHLSRSPILFQKICRIGKIAMRSACSRSDDDEKTAWLEVVRNILLPALSMTSGNSGLVSEVWVILRQLEYTERYSLYGEWKYSLYRRPELRVRQAEVEKEAKGILKRISSDNVKLSGRALAKASHANPTIFFTVALNQVQSYSNLIAPIVECAKYLTHFEYDIFGFSLIDALSNPEKDRTKQDGTSVSQWLQSLATFTGTLYWRYAMMDCSSVLQYIANQLKENNVKDLIIVRELVFKMTGIEPLANLSDSQVAALTGGRMLSMEAMMMANAGLASSIRMGLRKSGARLLHALMESRMLMPLLILIAQQRQACIHLVPEKDAHLKYLGNLFDTCQEVLFQYVEFLKNQLEPQQYAELIPSMDDLCRRFELEPAIASHIVRPRLTMQIRNAQARENEERLRRELLQSQKKRQKGAATGKSESPMASADESSRKEEEGSGGEVAKKEEEDKMAINDDGAAKDGEAKTDDNATKATDETPVRLDEVDTIMDTQESKEAVWTSALAEGYQAAEDLLDDQVKNSIGVHFYATFWQLGLSDLSVPTQRYLEEIQNLQRIAEANPEGVRGSIAKIRIEAQDCILKLRAELKEQELNHAATTRRLTTESKQWFSDDANRTEIVYAALQHCFLPRALLSPTDALFCGHFLRLMHTLGTRNFDTLLVYDKIFMEHLPALIFSTTENEARNFAKFLQTLLLDLTAWFHDEQRYEQETQKGNLPGFQIRWADRHGGEQIPTEDSLNHERFKFVLRKWFNMLRSTFMECLTSREYMRIRNCIVVMTRIASAFPLWEVHGVELMDTIASVAADEERGDLKILGQGLLATLKKEQKKWIPMPRKQVEQAAKESGVEKKDDAKVNGATPKESSADPQAKDDRKPVSSNDTEEPKGRSAPMQRSSSTVHKLPARPDVRANTPNARNGRDDPGKKDSTVTGSERSSGVGAKQSTNSSVQAARQAALDSMRESSTTTMNPPRAPNRERERERERESDRSRSGGWDAPARDYGKPLSHPSRNDDGRLRQPNRSRDPSPRLNSRTKTSSSDADAQVGSGRPQQNSSRAPSETRDRSSFDGRPRDRDGASTPTRRDRERERERDRDRSRDDPYPSGSGNRADRTRERPLHSDDRDRDRNRARREDDRRDDGRDARDAYNRRDRREAYDPASSNSGNAGSNARQPPAGARLPADQRRSNDTPASHPSEEVQRGNRREQDSQARHQERDQSSQRNRTASSSVANDRRAPQAVDAEQANNGNDRDRPNRNTPKGIVSSPGGSRKRSLADRLSATDTKAEGAPTPPRSAGGSREDSGYPASRRDNANGGWDNVDDAARLNDGNEPNKRPRLSRGSESDRRRGNGSASFDNSRGAAGTPTAPSAADREAGRSASGQADLGISIHGQGRRPAGASDGYGAGGGRDRHPSTGSGRDRERRRRERRSGG